MATATPSAPATAAATPVSTAASAATAPSATTPSNGAPTPQKPAGGTPMTREQGMAYYERMRKEVRELMVRKRLLDRNLAQYEENIYRAETVYLDDTPNGNIVKGFDNYIKTSSGGGGRRRANFSDGDRIFSLSSMTMAAELRRRDEFTTGGNTPGLHTASSTPTIAHHPHSSVVGAAARADLPGVLAGVGQRKKSVTKRRTLDESESPSEVETPGPKRVRISFSGQSGERGA